MSQITKTTCPYCGVGCGIDVTVLADYQIKVAGDKSHPANLGRLCSKGSALAETVDLSGRLLQPKIDGSPVGWDEATEKVANKFREIIEQHGPDAVAFYVSGQLLTEDYYLANKLMKGFIGSGNIDTNSRLCMSSAVAGYKRAFGSDTVPTNYEDIELADLVILVGSNTAWAHPVIYQRLYAAKKQRPEMKVVVIDPRRTATCDIADLHLPLASGTDAILFNGVLTHCYNQGMIDKRFVENHTQGLDETLRIASWYAPSATAVGEHCGLDAADVATFFDWFAEHKKVVTTYSQGVNQSSSGSDKVNAIINCHLLTGRIGLPGMGPFSITGQPNAMGGREVGALSNQLAAHMDFEFAEHLDTVSRFWQAPNLASEPGLKAVDLFKAVESGQIKAIWIMATNPVVSMPDANQVKRALQQCEFVVVSDCMEHTDTTAYADILLPATTWGERNGTVTNSERRISRQRPFLPEPELAKGDWWIISQVAQRMGYSGFDYQTTHQVFSEHAQLSGFENGGERDFDISALAELSVDEYDQLAPVQWPQPAKGKLASDRFFANRRFYTASGRARFIPITPRPPARLTETTYPFLLNTGRVRDHWHTMTRTGKSPRLSAHMAEPYAELHPLDATQLGINNGELVQVSSRWGEVIVRSRVQDSQHAGHIFIPIHWNKQFASAAGVGGLVNPEVDPVSGQPEFKHTPVNILPYRPAWHGFILTRKELALTDATYWTRTRRYGLWHYEVAGEQAPDNWAECARSMMCMADQDAQWSELFDSATSNYRAARFVDGGLSACIFIGPDYRLPERDWLIALFAKDQLDKQERLRVLAGAPGKGQEDKGAIVCSCFAVGRNTLVELIKEKAMVTPEALGIACQAGTNCGSCVPELRDLIAAVADA